MLKTHPLRSPTQRSSSSLLVVKSEYTPNHTTTMSSMSDLDRQIEQLRRCEIIKEHEVRALCAKAREILVEESNVQRVDSPVTVSETNDTAGQELIGI